MSEIKTTAIVNNFTQIISGKSGSGKTLTVVKMAVQAFFEAKLNGEKINIWIIDPWNDISRIFEIPVLSEHCGVTQEFVDSVFHFTGERRQPIRDFMGIFGKETSSFEGKTLVLIDDCSLNGSLNVVKYIQNAVSVKNFLKVRVIMTKQTRN